MDPDAIDAMIEAARDEESGDDALVPGGTSLGRVPHGGSDDPWLLDFSANVNPERPDGVAAVFDTALATAGSYPSDAYVDYRTAASEYLGCDARQVIPTAGGLAGIRLAFSAAIRRGETVAVPYPSFGEYAREVRLQGADPEFVPYDEIPAVDPADYAMVVACNPNNPTGDAYDPRDLQSLAERCAAADATLLVDEAFLGFTDRPTLAGQEGVVVARSLTKLFGLPGLRAGFLVATGHLRDRLDAARIAWGVGAPAAEVGAYCMRAEDFVEETRDRVASERERMAERLDTAYDVHRPSDAPFLLFDVGAPSDVDALVETCRDNDIGVRDARSFRGLDSHVRVAVRRPDENDHLLSALGV